MKPVALVLPALRMGYQVSMLFRRAWWADNILARTGARGASVHNHASRCDTSLACTLLHEPVLDGTDDFVCLPF